MKKILSLVLMLLCISFNAYADKQEWIDKSYDFGQSKRVLISLNIPNELKNGVMEHETSDIFLEKFKKDVADKLITQSYKFKTFADVTNDLNRFYGIDIAYMYQTEPQKAQATLAKYLGENFDMFLNANLLVYDTGSQYQEGYYYSMPTTQTSFVTTPNGMGTVTTQGTQQQYVPGGNVPVAYAAVKFELTDVKTSKPVWTRIDDRARANVLAIHNTKPIDLYKRIIGSYFDDLCQKFDDASKK